MPRVKRMEIDLALAIEMTNAAKAKAVEINAPMSIAVLDAGANGIFQIASQNGMLAIVAVLGSLYPATTALLARFILHERLHKIQITGVVLALAAAVALSLS